MENEGFLHFIFFKKFQYVFYIFDLDISLRHMIFSCFPLFLGNEVERFRTPESLLNVEQQQALKA